MKILIVYYSRTWTTWTVASQLSSKLNADIQEIIDQKDRSWVLGYINAWKDATLKKLTKIHDINHNIQDYDLVVVWTPIWAWTMSTPIRTFLEKYKKFINKKVAFFCTMWWSWDKKVFEQMQEILDVKPISTLSLTTKEVLSDEHKDKLNIFVEDLQ